jgi:glycosyltransferase involved in cell wall biosynthesis
MANLMWDILLPWQVRERLRSMLEFPARRAARAAIRRIRRAENFSLGFGGVLEDGRPVHGGAVKLLPLREAFGGDERTFSILYAVSSSQPSCAEELFHHCRRCGIAVVWNQNGVGYPAWAGRESERFNAPMRRLRAEADFVVYQSVFCKLSAEKFLGPCEIPSEILYNPVDAARFFPAPPKSLTPSPVRLLALGTHGTRDRVTCVLEALDELRKGGIEAELTVAGRFQWKRGEEDFAGEVSRLGLEGVVRRVVRFSQGDAPALYRAHDLLLHPKYMDPCPTVVLEAMASGLPVVGSASGGMPELVSPGCGILIEAPMDWGTRFAPTGDQLAEAVAQLVPDLPEAALLARQHAETRFALGPWLEAHERVFQSFEGL